MAAYSNAHPGLGLRKTYTFANEAEVKLAFLEVAKDYEEKVDVRLPPAPDFAEERLSYFSLAYNGGAGLLGDNLQTAVAAGDRADAWYEIRYQSNGDKLDGIAKRRFYESEIHKLYFDPASPSAEEAQQVGEMYTAHRDVILPYEVKYGAMLSADYNKGFAHDIYYNLQPAIQFYLKQNGVSGVRVEEFQLADATHVNLKGDGIATIDSAKNDQDLLVGSAVNNKLEGVQGNDVLLGLGGADTLDGGLGNDALYGGSGNDLMLGGDGRDQLDGGSGADRFIMKGAGLGNDTIGDFSLTGGDRLVLTGGTIYQTVDLGADVVLSFGTSAVMLVGVNTFDSAMVMFW